MDTRNGVSAEANTKGPETIMAILSEWADGSQAVNGLLTQLNLSVHSVGLWNDPVLIPLVSTLIF